MLTLVDVTTFHPLVASSEKYGVEMELGVELELGNYCGDDDNIEAPSFTKSSDSTDSMT